MKTMITISILLALASIQAIGEQQDSPIRCQIAPHYAGYYFRHWTDGVIPYEIEDGYSEESLSTIQHAIDEWNTKTIITLRPKEESDENYISIQWSGVEWIEIPSRIAVPVTEDNCGWPRIEGIGMRGGRMLICHPKHENEYAITHEIGHAIGMQHGQERGDRDQYIIESESSLRDSYWFDSNDRDVLPFDYRSIMTRIFASIPYGIFDAVSAGTFNTKSRNGFVWESSFARISPGDIDWVFWNYAEETGASIYDKKIVITSNLSFLESRVPMYINSKYKVTGEFDLDLETLADIGAFRFIYLPYINRQTEEARNSRIMYNERGHGFSLCTFDRYAFARWNSKNEIRDWFRISRGSTWIEANYVYAGTHNVFHSGTVCPKYGFASTERSEIDGTETFYNDPAELEAFNQQAQ